jgi:aspartyl-tRNA(Asn)/glutamyl-tRNA(Gln) amidotransferase subunit A
VRIPAALCGLVGFKPTYGRIQLDGVVPLAKSLDSVGPLTRTVEDAALLIAVMAGEPLPRFDDESSIDGMRITALAHEQFPDFIEPEIAKAYEETIALLRELGAKVTVERIPFDFEALGAKNGRIIGMEGYAVQRAYIDDENADIDPGVRQRMLLGKAASATDYINALEERQEWIRKFAEWMQGRDVLLTPMLPITARPVAEVDETTYPLATWSRAINYLAACAISVSARADSALPIATQLISATRLDSTAARAASALQSTVSLRPRLQP